MASVDEPNVHVLAMDGTSDDCDVPFKKMFEDLDFKKKYGINSINSVNWVYLHSFFFFFSWLMFLFSFLCSPSFLTKARIMVQIVYYFFCYFHVTNVRRQEENNKRMPDWPIVRFAVPSGGFGNCVAGYIAKQMGLPIELLACVNENVS